MKAALSLDLDNKWSYMKTHGDPGWETFPSYLEVVVPRALSLLQELGLRITFFIVGQDAAIAANAEPISQIGQAGHEIGNHSFHHEPWMHRRPEAEIDDELARAEESIEGATGQCPRGFRGPGFTQSAELLKTLVRRGYAYDASSLPTFIGPLARSYYFHTAKLTREAMREREDLFGRFGDGFRPNRQHRLQTPDGAIAEIPTTTFPGLRLPFHISYVLYIATISPALALAYFRTALRLCKASGTQPSILLHPLDFLTDRECPELAFFPAMALDPELKQSILRTALRMLSIQFEILPLGELVKTERPAKAMAPV
jgi:peptidoglycan/xylan/chitin deacetylase (PgdA/CDA1 family)